MPVCLISVYMSLWLALHQNQLLIPQTEGVLRREVLRYLLRAQLLQ